MNEFLLEGFPPVVDPDAKVLILGSMPSEESLRRRQYYAHARNQFWDIMGELFGAGRDVPYTTRLQRLRTRRVALWDVVHQCIRAGSLDSSIESESVKANDFARMFDECPGIAAMFFNGCKAEELFHRQVKPGLREVLAGVDLIRLPSTSPAHATLSKQEKVACWMQVLDHLS